MRLKENLRRKKELMHPDRFRFNYYIFPVWCVLVFAILITMCVVGGVYGDERLGLILCLLAFEIILCVLPIPYMERITKKELKRAIDEYSYLFEETDGCDTPVEAVDDELNIKFLVKKDGLQIIYPSKGEAVFSEMAEDTEFLPWTDAYLALASDNHCRRVRLALVVIDKTREQVFDDGVLPPEPFFLLMTKELYHGLVGLGLVEQIGPDFYYLRHNPADGMKKILQYGYIKKW